jgi:hypothetical protein
LEKQSRAECYGHDDTKDDNHAGERLVMRSTYLRQIVKCTNPLERAQELNCCNA